MPLAAFMAVVLAQAAAAPRIAGEYIEDRANKVYGCYCEWSGEGEHGGREAVLGWSIREGSYRGVSLAGVRVAAVIEGEGTLSKGNWPRKSILFFDRSASRAQRAAAEAMVRANFGVLLGKVLAVHHEPIEFRKEAGRAVMRIGDLLNVDMRKAKLPEDVLQGSILWYDPFVALEESTLGTTLDARYTGPEFDNRWSRSDPGVTGYYGTFSFTPR